MRAYAIGQGGHSKEKSLTFIKEHSVRTGVDVLLRPDRAWVDIWAKARTSDEGVEA